MSSRSVVAKQLILDPTHCPGLGQHAIADVGTHGETQARARGCQRRVLDSSVNLGSNSDNEQLTHPWGIDCEHNGALEVL
jgi:hypothetical protein